MIWSILFIIFLIGSFFVYMDIKDFKQNYETGASISVLAGENVYSGFVIIPKNEELKLITDTKESEELDEAYQQKDYSKVH